MIRLNCQRSEIASGSVGGGICFSKLIKNLAVLFPFFNSTQDQDQLELVCFTSLLFVQSLSTGRASKSIVINFDFKWKIVEKVQSNTISIVKTLNISSFNLTLKHMN